MSIRAIGTLAALLLVPGVAAAPLGTGFTYHGALSDGGSPANGLYDFEFCLFGDPGSSIPLACQAVFDDVPVAQGRFALVLDFGGAAFLGEQRFLELRLRPGTGGAFAILAPRQLVRAAPESLRASAASAAPWSGLSGVPAGFADNIDNDTNSGGTVTSVAAGAGLSGGTITGAGTLALANAGVGLAQIDTAQVQARVAGVCSGGQKAVGVNANGTLACAADVDSGGTLTRIDTGAGLAGGPITATGTLSIANGGIGLAQIDTAQVQARIAGTCPAGEYFRGVAANGSLACEPVPGITRVTKVAFPLTAFIGATSIAIGNDGVPVVAIHDESTGGLRVAKCANAACTAIAAFTTVDDPANNVGRSASIAVLAGGQPVIGYLDLVAGALKVALCANAACTGTAASIVTLPEPNAIGGRLSMAIGADGSPVISYHDATPGALKVAKCLNAACSVATSIVAVDDPVAVVGTHSSIAIGGDGFPVISYHDSTASSLKVAKCVNAACTGAATVRTTVDDPANVVGEHTSIAIGTDGVPVVSYYDSSALALKVAKCANPACSGAATITTVDNPVNSVGRDTFIGIGSDGLPVISYYDATAQALKLAKCANADCTGTAAITTVDDPANGAGLRTSLAIGVDGLPIVSYLDLDDGDLKVAKCGNKSCQ